MVNSRARKRKSTPEMTSRDGRKAGTYEVEDIIGFKLIKSELQFFIKWKGFDASYNTWEPLDNLDNCTIFRAFVNQKFKSLEKEIYVNICNIKQRLKKTIRQTMNQQKALTMYQIQPFDPFEYKVHQVFFHLVPRDDNYLKKLEDLVFKNNFFKLDQRQRELNDELLRKIRKKEDIEVTIENEEDYSFPPNFEYITKNFLTDEVYMIDTNNVKGCKCKECSISSDCCPQLKKEPFAYKKDKNGRITLRLKTAEKIFECGDLCECGSDCINRVSQFRKQIPLCLYKTRNRGWGLKAMANIPKQTFILEYVGELIGQREANARIETAYLFDLNHERDDKHFYTIDAFQYGNLSRFVNHSCDPNTRIWFISNCHGDPKNQKLW